MKTIKRTQIGGDHYKDMKIQPLEFIHANNIPFIEGAVIKYVCRHRDKNGVEDIQKAIHFLEMLINLEYVEDLCDLSRTSEEADEQRVCDEYGFMKGKDIGDFHP